jgi:DNA repair protein RecN (Recombination protein N)
MLAGLVIRDIVLIDNLDLDLEGGLCVLTGETGAGKSILLDALGLAIGGPADSGLIASGAEKGSVSAIFAVDSIHSVHALLGRNDIPSGKDIILRRVQGRDGRTRAFINDVAVSIGLLREVGDLLVEIHGQHDERGLLSAVQHRGLLDAYAGNGEFLRETAARYRNWQNAAAQLAELEKQLASGRAQFEFLSHAMGELESLAPEAGEEAELAQERQLIMNAEHIGEALSRAHHLFESDGGAVEDHLSTALAAIERVAPQAGGRLDNAIAALMRALTDVGEVRLALDSALADLDFDPGRLNFVEERLFALRAAARKHAVSVEELPALKLRLSEKLAQITDGDAALDAQRRQLAQTRKAYLEAATVLSTKRRASAEKLDAQVMDELRPLKLDKARFVTQITALDESQAGPDGCDRVTFLVSTNPGTALGPMVKIASGGELARFILALKVALASRGSAPTLIFDEVDRGVGGAVADAVGERLARLATDVQVIVVTHSPQVAARGMHHWRIEKLADDPKVNGGEQARAAYRTRVMGLDKKERREEIARMLAGAKVTDEARAAAARLIERQP